MHNWQWIHVKHSWKILVCWKVQRTDRVRTILDIWVRSVHPHPGQRYLVPGQVGRCKTGYSRRWKKDRKGSEKQKWFVKAHTKINHKKIAKHILENDCSVWKCSNNPTTQIIWVRFYVKSFWLIWEGQKEPF